MNTKDLQLKIPEISVNELQRLAEKFLDAVFKKVNAHDLLIEPQWDIDHLCYRVETEDDYAAYHQAFLKLGELLTEKEVRGRTISTFDLTTPITYKNWMIKLIELPAPKKGKVVKTGFEHLEMVVDKPLTEIAKRNPKLDWDKSGLEKTFNSELELSFGSCAIKFHNISLKSVINFEERPKMAILVSELRLLEMFKDNEPFIAGTPPLAIDLPNSDLDFLVTFADPNEFKLMCQQGFALLPEFEITVGEINDMQYSLCRFTYRGIPVEIFCASLSTFRQSGFLHFNAEEKLLKYGPPSWQQEVLNLKEMGYKTEPAFARLLQNDEIDAYQLILDIQRKPIQELRSAIRSSMN